MKRALALALTAAACGTNGDATNDAVDASTSMDEGESTTSSDATDGGETRGSSSSSSETSGVDASSSGAIDGTSSSSSEDSSSTSGDIEDCLPPEIFAAIDQHAHDVNATASLLATHGSQNEVTGFLLAPGLPAPPALPGSFAGLFMPCSEAVLFDEFCQEGRCSQLECTGQGAGWIHHLWIDPAIADDRWSFDDVHVDLQWSGDGSTTFAITTTATGPMGTNLSLTGAGAMDDDSMSVVETFPALHVAGDAVLEYAEDAGGYSGQLTIADVVVATVDAAGHLEPTGDCPS